LFKPKKIPLMKVNITHSLAGRVRLKSYAIKYLGKELDTFISTINSYDNLDIVNISPITGSILIIFDKDFYDTDDIVEIIERQLAHFSLLVYSKEREERNSLLVTERKLQEESISEIGNRIGISFLSLIYFSLNPFKGNSQSLLRKIISPVSLVSVSLSKNVIQSGISSLINTKRPNADTLTMSAIVTSILAGKGLAALTTILLSDVAELMTAYTMEKLEML